jgi:hypothetical protein
LTRLIEKSSENENVLDVISHGHHHHHETKKTDHLKTLTDKINRTDKIKINEF